MRLFFKFNRGIQIAFLLLLFLFICLWLISLYINDFFHIFDACNDRIISSNASISSLHTAVHYVRDCGATTDYVTHIKIQNNINHKNEAVFTMKGSTEDRDMNMTWFGDNHLEIQLNRQPEHIYALKTEYRGVVIEYKYKGKMLTSENVKRVNREDSESY